MVESGLAVKGAAYSRKFAGMANITPSHQVYPSVGHGKILMPMIGISRLVTSFLHCAPACRRPDPVLKELQEGSIVTDVLGCLSVKNIQSGNRPKTPSVRSMSAC